MLVPGEVSGWKNSAKSLVRLAQSMENKTLKQEAGKVTSGTSTLREEFLLEKLILTLIIIYSNYEWQKNVEELKWNFYKEETKLNSKISLQKLTSTIWHLPDTENITTCINYIITRRNMISKILNFIFFKAADILYSKYFICIVVKEKNGFCFINLLPVGYWVCIIN